MDCKKKKKKNKKQEKPVSVHITNHNKFEKGVGAFITNLNHLTIVMDSEGNMKLSADQKPAPVMPAEVVKETQSEEQDNAEEHKPCQGKLDKVKLARAIENCQNLFWGKSAYAVVFCICRDDLKIQFTQKDFELMVESLSYKKSRDYICTPGTISNAFSDNPIFRDNINNWENYAPMSRIIMLRDELRKELKVI